MQGGFGPRRPGGGFGGRRFRGRFPAGGRFAQGPLARQIQRQLVDANQKMLEGKPSDAAAVFARVSDFAQQNNMPFRAVHLSMQAAQAFLVGGQLTEGLVQFRRAVRLSLMAGDVGRAVRVAHRVLAELTERGYSDEAQALRAEFDAQFSQFGISLAAAPSGSAARPARLPAQCPACLGPVRPDEVEWIDEATAECAFCGTPLRAE